MASFQAGMIVVLVLVAVILAVTLLLIRRSTVSSSSISKVVPSNYGDSGSPIASAPYPYGPDVQRNESGGNVAGGSRYRARVGTWQDPQSQWNPFDPRKGSAARTQAARRRPRPVRHSGRMDYYTLLGVEPSATDKEIERAYRRRASQMHPDHFFEDPVRRQQAEVRLKQLNAAIEVLRDPLRRAKYDASL